MKYLNIITTATPRADVHNKCFLRYIKILLDNNPSYTIRLFVNLDKPSMISREEFEEAKQNILYFESVNEKLKLFFTTNEENPSFMLAAKTLYMSCAEQIKDEENNVFFWFEDDWILYTAEEKSTIEELTIRSTKEIEEFFESDKKILLLTGSTYLNGRPHLFKWGLFDEIVSMCKSEKLLDPEILLMEAKRKVFGDKTLRKILTDRSIHKCIPLFTDLGIRWRKNRNIQKMNRYFYKLNVPECDYTWVESRETIITIWRNAECSISDRIKQICDRSDVLYEEKVIGIDCSREEVPSASLGVLPYFSFYDLSIGSFDEFLLFLEEEKNKKYSEDAW